MEQTKALNALEPFLALTKSATSLRAAADLVTRATSHPGTFLFTELLATPQIQALATDKHYAPYLTLLQIFSYGSYALYASTAGLPPLNDAQAAKLRQLSLLTLARDRSALSYAALQGALAIASPRALEDLVVAAVYAGLLSAVLDPRERVVRIAGVAPLRDAAPGSVPDTLRVLGRWSARLDAALGGLEAQMQAVREGARGRAAERSAREAALARLVEEEAGEGTAEMGPRRLAGIQLPRKKTGGPMGGGGGGGLAGVLRHGKRGGGHLDVSDGAADDEAMDVDEEEDDAEGKKKTSRRKL